MGPGRLLQRINELNPNLDLYGLDISKAMYKRAKENLRNNGIELIHGNIMKTDFASNLFDIVTCTGSFYLWDHPKESLREIHRILKKPGLALFFETYSDYNKTLFKKSLKENLKKVKVYKRPVAKKLLYKQLNITYTSKEVKNILKDSVFSENFTIEKITISNLPMWLKLSLKKK